MIKKIIFFTFFFALSITYAQYKKNIANRDQVLEVLGNEKTYLDLNTLTPLAGETIYYKFYSLDINNTLSTISKVGYIELINDSYEVVLTQKIELKKSIGYGDIFIPTSIPSGNYKLLAYTQWMKNWGVDNFYQEDILIINPYQANQKSLIQNNKKSNETITLNDTGQNNLNDLEIILNDTVYTKREKVILNINIKNLELLNGNYSLTVQKQDLDKYKLESSKSNATNKFKTNFQGLYIPEIRGELLCGKIIGNDTISQIRDRKVVLNILNRNDKLIIANTDTEGNFCLNISKNSLDSEGVLQVLDDAKNEYKIEIEKKENLDYNSLTFNKYFINEDIKTELVTRSIHNQIENAYYSVKPDTIILPIKSKPFYGNLGEKYLLDDYTRFNSFKETIIEIINEVWIDEKNSILIQGINEQYSDGAYKPLLIVDGIILNDVKQLYTYNVHFIESITVVRDKYFIGGYIFAGILDIKTFDNDFYKNYQNVNNKKIIFDTALANKNYFKQNYIDSSKYSHIPDYRNKLYWNPELNFSLEKNKIEFYTSDVTGVFNIKLNGFSKLGKPIRLSRKIVIK